MKRMLTLLIAMHFMVLAFGNAGTASGEKGLKEDRANLEKALKSMKFVLIQPGMFMMGSPPDEAQRRSNETMHKVTITKPFYMQATEVTQAQWKAVMGENPSKFTDCGGGCPVEQVSWEDVQIFINKLNLLSGRKYRLPTEAEWEYACRAGTTTPFNTGICLPTNSANYKGDDPYKGCEKGDYRKKTVTVASFPPNDWGLYDMHGSVLEWCQDSFGDYPSGNVADPSGPSSGSARVLRGGSWSNGAMYCRSAFRDYIYPFALSHNVGFRLALSPSQ